MELSLISSLLIGYLFGCLVSGYIVGRLSGKVDIREHGSGNAGTTNAIRILGWRAGILTFLGDFFKGIIAVLIAKYLFANSNNESLIVAFSSIGVIFGHNWPVFLNFRGGKGVATTFGVLAVMNFWIALIAGIYIITMIALTRYVSLSAITASLLIPILFLFLDGNIHYIIVTILLAILSIYKHRANIKRLINGTESKLGKKKE